MGTREIKAFVSNAQLALTEHVPDDRIPAVADYSKSLLSMFEKSKLPKHELATVLVTVAWNLMYGGKDDKVSGVR
jgi:hypothetical protein